MITATPEVPAPPAPEQRLAAIGTLLADPKAIPDRIVDKARPLNAQAPDSQ